MSDFPRHGIHPELEDEANRIIRESLKGVTKRSEKSDVLTPWKEQDRRGREVYNTTGVAEPTMRQGMFHRAWNPARPELNSVDGVSTRGRRIPRGNPDDHSLRRGDSSSLASFVAANLRIEDNRGEPIALSFGEPES
jgi:hypothetical protein